MKERIIKTTVPYLVGLILALATTWGVAVPADVELAVVQLLTFVIGTLYYVIVVFLAKKFPWAERLLGSSKAPEYTAPKA